MKLKEVHSSEAHHWFNKFSEKHDKEYSDFWDDIENVKRNFVAYIENEIKLIEKDDYVTGNVEQLINDHLEELKETNLDEGEHSYFKRIFYYKTKFEEFKNNKNNK